MNSTRGARRDAAVAAAAAQPPPTGSRSASGSYSSSSYSTASVSGTGGRPGASRPGPAGAAPPQAPPPPLGAQARPGVGGAPASARRASTRRGSAPAGPDHEVIGGAMMPTTDIPPRFCVYCRGEHVEGKHPAYGPQERLYGLGLDTTLFSRVFSGGLSANGLPGMKDGRRTDALRWLLPGQPAEGLDYDKWAPVYASGLRDPEPLRQTAAMGLLEMACAAPKALLPALPRVVAELRAALNSGRLDVVAAAADVTRALLRADASICPALLRGDLLRRLLPVPVLMRDRTELVRVGYPPKALPLNVVIEALFDAVLDTGGPAAAATLRDYLPTLSYVPQLQQ